MAATPNAPALTRVRRGDPEVKCIEGRSVRDVLAACGSRVREVTVDAGAVVMAASTVDTVVASVISGIN